MLVYYHNRDNNPNRVVNIVVFSSLSKRQIYTELVTKEGKVENGDVAIIDFEGFKDGVAFLPL